MTSSAAMLKAAIIIAVLSAAAVEAATPAAATCYASWSDAAPIVRREGLMPARDVHVLARQHLDGIVLRITLCEEDGKYVYRLVVREPQGRLRNVTVDARRPFTP